MTFVTRSPCPLIVVFFSFSVGACTWTLDGNLGSPRGSFADVCVSQKLSDGAARSHTENQKGQSRKLQALGLSCLRVNTARRAKKAKIVSRDGTATTNYGWATATFASVRTRVG